MAVSVICEDDLVAEAIKDMNVYGYKVVKPEKIVDVWAREAAEAMRNAIDKQILSAYGEDIFDTDWDPLDEETEEEEWDGQIPDPFVGFEDKNREFVAVYLSHIVNVLTVMSGGAKKHRKYDMTTLQMQCDDCAEWGPCNVTNGFADRPCHRGSRRRKDGFYFGKWD